MFPGKFHLLRVAGSLLGVATSLCAGDFVAPAEGPVAFRRDRIPLDAEAMASLSVHLVTLAEGLPGKVAAERRCAAQLLALSAALDPANTGARALVAKLAQGAHPLRAAPEALKKCRERIRNYLAWLGTPAAGADGQALAACLTDVLSVSDPQHPQSEALLAGGERGAWAGWIPALAAYEPEPVAKSPPEDATPEDAALASPGFLLAKARVFAPLWKRVAKAEPVKWILSPEPLQMSAEVIKAEDGAPMPFSIIIGPPGAGALPKLSKALGKLLANQRGGLPAVGRISINSSQLEASLQSGKLHTFHAAVAVLASAALSGREPDATIIGRVDETGAFTLPAGFWDQIQSLGPGNGGRLVLPAAAAGYLPSMLALERPQFFLEYEVLLAANFQELLDLTAKAPVGPLAEVSTNFREIRDKAGSQAVGPYLANPFVRRRLAEIVQKAPNHVSARLLGVQGAGERAVAVTRAVLASELRRAIEPMDWIVKRTVSAFTLSELDRFGPTSDTCAGQVTSLVRRAEKNDRELVQRVQDMLANIRTLDRAARIRDGEIDPAYRALMDAYQACADELALAGGDAPAGPQP